MTKVLLALGALLLAGCSSLKVNYDYDKSVDFSKYKTFAFTEEAQKLKIQELDRTRLMKAVEREMLARGFTKTSNPDVWVDLHVKVAEKQSATADAVGFGAYGTPWRYGYGSAFTTTNINIHEYLEGTLFINLVDKVTDKLVWQGRGTKIIDEDVSPEEREENINHAVTAIFKKYPAQPPKAK